MDDISTENETGLPTLIYAIYFVALFTGIPFLIGVIIAYLARGEARPIARSHYQHQITIFWRVFLGGILGWALIGFGIPLSFVLIGIPMIIVGALLLLYLFVWTLVRCIRGVTASSNDRGFDHEESWAF